MNSVIKKIGADDNLSQKTAWVIFSVLLLALLIYGLSFFWTQPKIETITTNPANTDIRSNSYINQTQDVHYQKSTRRNSK
jgi:hypothetical protein